MENITKEAPLSILLADDDIDDRTFFKGALDKFPIATHFTAVNDGEQLMKVLADNLHQLPHVVFLDLNMPRKNGFECLDSIKQHSDLQHIPVIMYSTSLEQEVVNRLYKNGAQYFIRKPSEFPNFINIIQKALTLVTKARMTQPLREQFILSVSTERENNRYE